MKSQRFSFRVILLTLILSAFNLFGCQFKKKSASESAIEKVEVLGRQVTESQQVIRQSSLRTSDIQTEFIGQSKANDYQLKIQIPKHFDGLDIEVSILDEISRDGSWKLIYSGEGIQGNTFELPAKGKREYRIKATGLIKNQRGNPATLQVTSPYDLILQGTDYSRKFLDSRTIIENQFGAQKSPTRMFIKADRLFLTSDLVLESYDRHLEINTNIIVSQFGAKISAGAHDAGSSSQPTLKIKARQLIGTLRIVHVGTRGKDAIPGEVLANQNEARKALLAIPRHGSPGQPGIIGTREIISTPIDGAAYISYFCQRQPTSGGPGQPAISGVDAAPAGNGYSSGPLSISIENMQEGFISLLHRGGFGGRGAPGSPVIPPGEGGQPGSVVDGRYCRPAPQGPAGSWETNGIRATPGRPAADGYSGETGPREFSSEFLTSKRWVEEEKQGLQMIYSDQAFDFGL